MSKVWSHDNDRPALGNGLGNGGLAGEEGVNGLNKKCTNYFAKILQIADLVCSL